MNTEFKEHLKATLNRIWQEVLESSTTNYNENMHDIINLLIHSETKTYRYPVITQLLAKCVNEKLDCRCIQATRGGNKTGNFDARSVCHEVVVPWENINQNPLGGSKEPYINNPLRKPEFTQEYRDSQKNKIHWDLLVNLFQYIEDEPHECESALKQALVFVKGLQQSLKIHYPIPLRLSLEATLLSIKLFLKSKSGGERLQLIYFALFDAQRKKWGIYDEVQTGKINEADTFANKAADIVCIKDGEIILAIEVKDRTSTLELLNSSITKARLNGVKELLNVAIFLEDKTEKEIVEKEKSEFSNGLNIYMVDSQEYLKFALIDLGEEGRRLMFESICHGLDIMSTNFKTKQEWASILEKM